MRIDQNAFVLDVDGVLLNFDGGFARVAPLVLGRPVNKLSSHYPLDKRYDITSQELDRVMDEMHRHPEGWCNLPILPGAAEAFRTLREHGKQLHLVTGICSSIVEQRLDNLSRHALSDIADIHCVGFGNASKRSVIERIAPVCYVDDRLHLLNECDFVPDRVFVDHGDEQYGHVVDESIIHVTSLSQWVRQWALTQVRQVPARPRPAMA